MPASLHNSNGLYRLEASLGNDRFQEHYPLRQNVIADIDAIRRAKTKIDNKRVEAARTSEGDFANPTASSETRSVASARNASFAETLRFVEALSMVIAGIAILIGFLYLMRT